MKKHLFLFLTCSILFVNTCFTQSMDNFFKYEGVTLLAGLAHPTNTYSSGQYSVYSDYVLADIFYEGYTTKLKIYRDGDYFTGIIAIKDTDFVPPFAAIELIKNFLIEGTENTKERQKVMNDFEKMFNTALVNMTGKQMACVALTVSWFSY